jgi:hypothetical protein
MASRLQLVSIVASLLTLLGVLELVRRRRLMERYALLWLLSAVVLLALASWPGGLHQISRAIGIAYPPTALFVVAFAFVLFLLLHFSTAMSRLSDQTKVLAQRLALLEDRVRQTEQDHRAADYLQLDDEVEQYRSERERQNLTRVSPD